jgi:hypothetical protein
MRPGWRLVVWNRLNIGGKTLHRGQEITELELAQCLNAERLLAGGYVRACPPGSGPQPVVPRPTQLPQPVPVVDPMDEAAKLLNAVLEKRKINPRDAIDLIDQHVRERAMRADAEADKECDDVIGGQNVRIRSGGGTMRRVTTGFSHRLAARAKQLREKK